jgi:Macrocin-O-methyltransferase (TylF)
VAVPAIGGARPPVNEDAHVLGNLLKRMLGSQQPGSVAGDELATLAALIRAQSQAALLDLLHETPKPPRAIDYEGVAYVLAAASSARYFVEHMRLARNFGTQLPLLEFALGQCAIEGLMLEFGVYTGRTLAAIARGDPRVAHGFDSFEGLPEDWTHFQKKGRFGLDGALPKFAENNVELHAGWFTDTLPPFLGTHPGPVRFLHVDSDLYSSAVTVLEGLHGRIVAGTVILFDEYINYPGWEQDEFRAFQEFVARHGVSYEYLGFASSHCSVAVKITGVKA